MNSEVIIFCERNRSLSNFYANRVDAPALKIGGWSVSQRKGERKEKWSMREKCPNNSKPAYTASTIGPCPTIMQWGRSGGAMVLSKLPVPGRPTIWIQ